MKRFAIFLLAVTGAAAVWAAVRVWSQTDGVWSTSPSDTPFTGRSFNNGDIVIFTDPENLTIDAVRAHVTVSGTVVPQTITFTNAVTMYIADNAAPGSRIGTDDDLGRVQFIEKYGLAPVTVDTPICYKNVLVADGVLTLNNMDAIANMVRVKSGATFNFRYTGDIDERAFSVYNLESDSTWHRLGTSHFRDLYFPTDGSTYAPGSRTLFDLLTVSGNLRVFSENVYIGVTQFADIGTLEAWNGATFTVTGRDNPAETNNIKNIDVLCAGRVNLKHGYFCVGTLTTNSAVAEQVAAGATDRGWLVVGGDRDDPVPTYFHYDSPPGIVYTENDFIGHTFAEMPAATVGGMPDVNSYLFITNGATVNIHGGLFLGGGNSLNRLRRVFIGDGADVTLDGHLDFTGLTNFTGKADARVMVSNATLRASGIKFGPKDLNNKIRQIIIKDGATFELGADNEGENIAGVDTRELGLSYAGTKDQHRALILDNATLRYTADQTLDQTIFLQEARTNTIDLAGHTVTNSASVNPYYAGASSGSYSGSTYTCCRFEIRDSSPEQNGFLFINSPHWSVRNGYSKDKPAGYIRKHYGTQLISGRLRMNPAARAKDEDCGFSLHGGILELPVGTDYPNFIKHSYDELCDATSALACIWDSEVGAIIRCYCSSENKLITRAQTNTWQLVCEVVSDNPTDSFKDGIAIDKFMKETAFQLIDESTGAMLPGATFAIWPLQKAHSEAYYADQRVQQQKYEEYLVASNAYEVAMAEYLEKQEAGTLTQDEMDNPPVKPKPVSKGDLNNGWWYTNESTTNRFAVLMRYEPDVADVPDLYWRGKTGEQTLSDENTDVWLTAEGDAHRYGDGVNIYITNLTARLDLELSRSTGLRVEEIVMTLGPDGKETPLIGQDGMVVTNFYSAGHTGEKAASPKTLNVYDCGDVFIDSKGAVIATSGVCVSNSVVEVDGYLLVDGNIAVIDSNSGLDNGSWLTATQLVHRSTWFVSSNATFHAGYMDPNVWFSTMSHTITNYGSIVYNLNGRTEYITQSLTYPDDVKMDQDDGYLCYYEFENGVLEFYGTDYLTRRANTNVWISTGCTRHIMDEGHSVVQSAQSYSPLGYQKGGKLLVDTPYISRRGSVLRSQAEFELHDELSWIPGASFTVAEHQVETLNDGTVVKDWSGEIVIHGTGSINFMDEYWDGETVRTFAEQPFVFTIAEGETNRIDVAMTGHADIVIDGGGTLVLGDALSKVSPDSHSTVEGTLTVKSGSSVVVEGLESLGYLDVIVEPGAYLIFKDTGRPQRFCRSITMQEGSHLGLGPDSGTIEPENPIRLLELGTLTMPRLNADAITLYTDDENSLKDPLALTEYSVSNVVNSATGTIRYYGHARAFQNQYVELFGVLNELVWDRETPEGSWFSRILGVDTITTDPLARWHAAKDADPLSGYTNDTEFLNFKNDLHNSVAFLSPARVTVNNRLYEAVDFPQPQTFAETNDEEDEGDGDEEAETGGDLPARPENRLLPSGIIFGTPPGTEVDPDSAPGATLSAMAQSGAEGAEIRIIGSADDAVIGSADDAVIAAYRTSVLATRGTDAVVNVPIWLRNLTVEKNSYLRLRDLVSPPELTVVEKGSHLAFGAKFSDFTWRIDSFRGEGRVDKIGDKNVVFDLTADALFPNPLGVREGELKLKSLTQEPTHFTGGLFLTRYEESLSTAPLTIYNTAGKFGMVFDGSAAPYNEEINDHAVLCGRTFGITGRINVNIAPGKIYHIEAPIAEYTLNDGEDIHSHVTIAGGTIRFSEGLGASDQYRENTLVDITSAADNRVELNGKSLYIQNALFNGTLAAIHNADADLIIRDDAQGENVQDPFDKIYRIDFPGATNETPLIDFPMPVKLSVVRVPTEPTAIAAYDENGRELPCEMDSYIPDTAGVNDSGLLVWVSVPALTKDSHIFVGIKTNAGARAATIDPGLVWKDYLAVWHMNVDRNGTMPESTTNHWETTYVHANDSGKFDLTTNYDKWQGLEGPLGRSFWFNDRSVSGDGHNGFAVTNGMIKFLSELPAEERTGLTVEGFFEFEKEKDAKTVPEFQKVLSYRPPEAKTYNFAWLSMQAGALWGSYIAYVTNSTDNGVAIVHDAEKMPIQAPEDGWFFSGATLTNSTKEVGQILALGDQQKYFTSYAGGSSTTKATSITLGDGIFDAATEANPKARVGLGCRMDADTSTSKLQAWTGRMCEVRVRKGSVTPLWLDTVRRTTMMNKLFTSVTDVSLNLHNAIKATESIRFARGSVIEIQPGNTDDNALLLDLTTTNAEGEQARLITSSADAGVTIDLTQFGEIPDAMDGTTLINVRGTTPVNIFAFKLGLDETQNDPQKWALRALKYTAKIEDERTEPGEETDENGDPVMVVFPAKYENGTYIQLVKAQGAVMIISPAASSAEEDAWSATNPAATREFAADGHDFAVIPRNYNAGTDLHAGAVIRDRYEGRTDGVTHGQLIGDMTNPNTPNTDYWFWFEGDNGAWSETQNYTLNLRDENGCDENDACYLQFAVTNQIFYGQATDTLNSGELGFYVTWDPESGTNLVARVLNTTQKVEFPLDGVEDPWLVVSVTINPFKSYDIFFNGKKKTISTNFAEHPKQMRITGVAPVDNIFVSFGDPNRKHLVYVHDMTLIGYDKDNKKIWVDAPIETTETYFDLLTSKAVAAGFVYSKPTVSGTVQTLPVAFRCRTRRAGVIYDSDKYDFSIGAETGNEHLERIEILNLVPETSAETVDVESKDYGKLKAYKFNYTYALAIADVKRYANNAVSIFSVLSNTAEDYDEAHLLGSAGKPHLLNGYLLIEATESTQPYDNTTAKWRPVSVSAASLFGDKHYNETYVGSPTVHSNLTYRIRIQKDYPVITTTPTTPEAPTPSAAE